jgi:hypothetical protein
MFLDPGSQRILARGRSIVVGEVDCLMELLFVPTVLLSRNIGQSLCGEQSDAGQGGTSVFDNARSVHYSLILGGLAATKQSGAGSGNEMVQAEGTASPDRPSSRLSSE